MKTTAIFLTLAILCGCSPVMEAMRPDPVDLSQFSTGEDRVQVGAALPAPSESAVKEGANICDVYRIYTKGPETGGRVAIAVGETVADVFTLCLTELIFTPVEIATRNSQHPVMMCYGPDDRLEAVKELDQPGGGSNDLSTSLAADPPLAPSRPVGKGL